MSVKEPLPFLLGAFMVTALAAVSLAVVAWSPLAEFPEIKHACLITHLAAPDCVAGAFVAGISTFVAFAFVLILALWIMRRDRAATGAPLPARSLLTILFLVFCFALIAVHLIEREWAPAYGSRIAELERFSNFISLENLTWPLLIQFLLLEREWRIRGAAITALLLIVTLTPYRSVDLAIFMFGILLPLAYSFWDAHCTKWSHNALRPVAAWTVLAALVGTAFLCNGFVDSQARALTGRLISAITNGTSASGTRVTDEKQKAGELSTLARFRQRLAYPLYQAAIVDHLSKTAALPSILDELRRKFRLSNVPNLNEFVYKMIYPGDASVGETTSLYYGEGAAYFGKAGLIWALGAPLAFVIAWLALVKVRLEASAVLGIALWRSSFAGLITVLPALVLQVAVLFILTRCANWDRAAWLKGAMASRLAVGLLLILVAAATAAQAWTSVDASGRADLVRISFLPGTSCTFDFTKIGDLTERVDATLAASGRAVKSSLVADTPARIDLILPYGGRLGAYLRELVAPISSFTTCTATGAFPRVRIGETKMVSGLGVIPLNLLALAAAMLSAILLGQILIRANLLSVAVRDDRTDWALGARSG
ncbi:MAG: hypothetical protein WBF58_21095 [Xanthobacteraceae bacterium]